jgi:hypothetical protein
VRAALAERVAEFGLEPRADKRRVIGLAASSSPTANAAAGSGTRRSCSSALGTSLRARPEEGAR